MSPAFRICPSWNLCSQIMWACVSITWTLKSYRIFIDIYIYILKASAVLARNFITESDSAFLKSARVSLHSLCVFLRHQNVGDVIRSIGTSIRTSTTRKHAILISQFWYFIIRITNSLSVSEFNYHGYWWFVGHVTDLRLLSTHYCSIARAHAWDARGTCKNDVYLQYISQIR